MNTTALPHMLWALLILTLSGVHGQVADYAMLPNSPAYEAAADRLRQAPSGEYKFSEARLGDVLQLLADEAGLSFFSLPSDSEVAQRMVTFTIHSSPFLALETLAKANGIALILENSIWYLRPENDTNLIGRVYQIQYNSREEIKTNSTGGNTGTVASNSTGTSTTSSSSIDLQGATASFEVEPSRLLEDVKELLGIKASVTPILAGSTSVDALAGGSTSASNMLLPQSITNPLAPGLKQEVDDARESAKVIWNSDSNSLYVVATRQQHSWIEGYLASSDKAQDQIAIEVKFIEMNRDPQIEFGLDWSGTLSNGYDVNTRVDPVTFDPSNPSGFQLPSTAIVSFESLNLKLRALAQDKNTKSLSYPRMVTTNNREVILRSVVNQPVLAGTASTSVGGGATATQAISYLPIGTVLNILPKRLGDGKIQLNIALTVSRVIGQEVITGNPYPIASSRVYRAPVEVDDGYTVAIGGLDEANWSQGEEGVPVLRKVPVIGYAFKSRSARRTRQSLMIMITPRVINTQNGGLPDRPESLVRLKPGDPPPPAILPDGTLVQQLDGMDETLTRLSHEVVRLEAAVDTMSVEREEKEQLFALFTSVRSTRAKLKEWTKSYPGMAEQIGPRDHEFALLEQRLEQVQRRARWMLY
ncbi:MAG: hypothetical protein KGS60_13850 [Verrucomicrobia bacterium]|nr:hypothetical protein [Verrucomicrobiota bacterium]